MRFRKWHTRSKGSVEAIGLSFVWSLAELPMARLKLIAFVYFNKILVDSDRDEVKQASVVWICQTSVFVNGSPRGETRHLGFFLTRRVIKVLS
jgi:hypothetical protein